jgi:hypothetical protein
MVAMAGLQVFIVRFFFQGARKGEFHSWGNERMVGKGCANGCRLCVNYMPRQLVCFEANVIRVLDYKGYRIDGPFYDRSVSQRLWFRVQVVFMDNSLYIASVWCNFAQFPASCLIDLFPPLISSSSLSHPNASMTSLL